MLYTGAPKRGEGKTKISDVLPAHFHTLVKKTNRNLKRRSISKVRSEYGIERLFAVNLFSVSLVLRALLARHSTRLLVAGSGNGSGSGTIKTDLHKYRQFSATAVDLVSDQQMFNEPRERRN